MDPPTIPGHGKWLLGSLTDELLIRLPDDFNLEQATQSHTSKHPPTPKSTEKPQLRLSPFQGSLPAILALSGLVKLRLHLYPASSLSSKPLDPKGMLDQQISKTADLHQPLADLSHTEPYRKSRFDIFLQRPASGPSS